MNNNYIFYDTGAYGTSNITSLCDKEFMYTPNRKKKLLKISLNEIEKMVGPLFEGFEWQRIVLDEGHEAVTEEKFIAAVMALKARFRWYITGMKPSIPSLRPTPT